MMKMKVRRDLQLHDTQAVFPFSCEANVAKKNCVYSTRAAKCSFSRSMQCMVVRVMHGSHLPVNQVVEVAVANQKQHKTTWPSSTGEKCKNVLRNFYWVSFNCSFMSASIDPVSN